MQLIKQQHISEKSSKAQSNDQYIVQVAKKANKPELKKYIEKEFNVNVQKIRIINLPRKKIKYGKFAGYKQAIKKAVIKLKHGQKIDFWKKEKSREK